MIGGPGNMRNVLTGLGVRKVENHYSAGCINIKHKGEPLASLSGTAALLNPYFRDPN